LETFIGDIPGSGHVSMDYSFDYLCIVGGGNAYLYDGATLQQITDPDLGIVIFVVWIDGYFAFTDGEFIIVSDLTDPFTINPLRYGSSEADPDPIRCLLELRGEFYAVNGQTIEVFNNIGQPTVTTLFPFQRNNGAIIPRGAIGPHCAVVFMEAIAFLGGGRNEAPAVWIGINGSTSQISTREIDLILESYTTEELAQTLMEVRVEKNQQLLYVHLPNQTLVYDGSGSVATKQAIWYVLSAGLTEQQRYRAQDFVWQSNRWTCADAGSGHYGYVVSDVSTLYGDDVAWDLSTMIFYNKSDGALFHRLELVGLPGRVAFGDDPRIWTSYSTDGMTFSQPKAIRAGVAGDRTKRLVWFQQGMMHTQRVQRFSGTSAAHIPIASLEAQVESLAA